MIRIASAIPFFFLAVAGRANPPPLTLGIFNDPRCVRALESIAAEDLARFERYAEHRGTTPAEKQEYIERRKRTAYLIEREKEAESDGASARDFTQFVNAGMRVILERSRDRAERDYAYEKLVEDYDSKVLAEERPTEGHVWLRAEVGKWPKEALAAMARMRAASDLLLARAALARWRAEVSKELLKARLNSTVSELSAGARRRALGRAMTNVENPGEVTFNGNAVARALLENRRIDPFIQHEIEREIDFMNKVGRGINDSPAGLHFLKMVAGYYQIDLTAFPASR